MESRTSATAAITVLALALAGCVVNVVAAPEGGSTVAPDDSVPASPATAVVDTVGEVAPGSLTSSTVLPEGNGGLVIVGDSLTLGADISAGLVNRLEELGWEVSFDAAEGRTTPKGVDVLADLLAVTPAPQAVLVGLGTNDRGNPAEFRPLVESVVALTMGSDLYWMSIEWDGRSRLQGILDEFEMAGSLTQVDFRPVIAAHPEYVGSDGIHFTEEGYAARAHTIVEDIGKP